MKRLIIFLSALTAGILYSLPSDACTGISLSSADGGRVVARTVEWASTPMQCGYVVVPRGHVHRSFTPEGEDGMRYESRYGYVGIYTEYEPFIVEGVNEAGLSAGLFFFPGYGQYAPFDSGRKDRTLSDMQFVSWVLSQFSTIDELRQAMDNIDLVTLNNKIGAVHWRICQNDGRMAVLEIEDGVPHFYDNPLGVLTNSPGFPWHMTNLDNYVNLVPGSAPDREVAGGVTLKPIGGGSGMLGLPGDFTPPSRFVRAAFLASTAPKCRTTTETVMQAFHLLNNFDVPVGFQNPEGKIPDGLPSATQFTSVTDQTCLKLYYRTAWNCNIRCIDLKSIDFGKVKYQSRLLDEVKEQPVEAIEIG